MLHHYSLAKRMKTKKEGSAENVYVEPNKEDIAFSHISKHHFQGEHYKKMNYFIYKLYKF
uniref:Uncharacterized protein n=1 Tax=Arion vulgaris TaxID=1028688 RepID=A0A0B6YQY8_9EUPU